VHCVSLKLAGGSPASEKNTTGVVVYQVDTYTYGDGNGVMDIKDGLKYGNILSYLVEGFDGHLWRKREGWVRSRSWNRFAG
jgi:hypothetical protein